MSRDTIRETLLNNNTSNNSWENFLENCLDFENIEPETKFIKITPLNEQMKKAKMIADLGNLEDPNVMKLAVSSVLKAMCTPAKSENSFALTSAMLQFVERFNSGKITGTVRDILYEIVGQESGTILKVDHFTEKEKEITQLSEAAIEHEFDPQAVFQQSPQN